jgi:hypothetical protein
MSSKRLRQRSILARISSALAFQMNGLGARLQAAMNASIASIKSATLAKLAYRNL